MRFSMLTTTLLCLAATFASAAEYQAGAASNTINPHDGAYLAGYGRDRRADGRHDDLYLKAAHISDGETTLVIITLDNIGLTRPDVRRIQNSVSARLGTLPPAQVIVSSSHTHAGPDVVGLWGSSIWSSGRDEAYVQSLVDQAARTAASAAAQSQPVSLHVRSASAPLSWVENVSEPELLDPTISVMQMLSDNGTSVLTLTNYACHPTVLGPENTRVSADYLAGFYTAMHRALPGEHLFLQGAIGGWIQPLQGDRSIDRARKLGKGLAATGLRTLQHAERGESPPIRFASREFDVQLDNWLFRLAMWLGVLERNLHDDAMRTESAVFNIGDARFATHPGETSPYYSLKTRELLGSETTFILGLTQDAMGYILKTDYFDDDTAYPSGEYLKSVSVGREAGPRLMQTLRALVQE